MTLLKLCWNNLIRRATTFGLLLFLLLSSGSIPAQGTWTPVTQTTLDTAGGVMILLSDGSVLAKTYTGGADGYGNVWMRLTPDSGGSYVNGSWAPIAPMQDTRLYFSSQLLKDGRLYVAGGEYGSGKVSGETYDPLTNTWTPVIPLPPGDTLFDANSAILPDGRILQSLVYAPGVTYSGDVIYDPASNSYTGPIHSHGSPDESAFVKMPDNSILFIDNAYFSANNATERYIPSVNQWVRDADVPDTLWKLGEIGTGMLLPNGQSFFVGASGHTAYYTPSGTVSPGVWSAGPDLPSGLGTPDAPMAMMPNGKILLAAAPIPTTDTSVFLPPTSFYEFDYLTNTYIPVSAPGGGMTINQPCFYFNFLDLPDGTVLISEQGNPQYYVYQPIGSPLLSGKPTISQITHQTCNYTITGTLFNGISEGTSYGDDWQSASNYPVIRLTKGANVFYARTFNWNRTGVQTGALADTAEFTLPPSMPAGTYSLVVTANGIASDPVSFIYTPCPFSVNESTLSQKTDIRVYPNPVEGESTVLFNGDTEGPYRMRLTDVLGRSILEEQGIALPGNNSFQLHAAGIAKGIYLLILEKDNMQNSIKVSIN